MSQEFRFVYHSAVYDETVTFLRDALDFPVLASWDRPGDHRGTLFAAASGIVEVLENEQAGRAAPGAPFMVIEVENVDAVHSRVVGKGVAVHHELRDKPWGHRGFSVLDPNGVEIAFFTWVRR